MDLIFAVRLGTPGGRVWMDSLAFRSTLPPIRRGKLAVGRVVAALCFCRRQQACLRGKAGFEAAIDLVDAEIGWKTFIMTANVPLLARTLARVRQRRGCSNKSS